jgi:hypothetical protein
MWITTYLNKKRETKTMLMGDFRQKNGQKPVKE